MLRVLMPLRRLESAIFVAAALALPGAAAATTAGNPLCPGEEVSFNPDNGQDIGLPDGFKVSVFAKGLNFPTGIAFRGNSHRFEVYVLESGAFPASRCNNGAAWQANGLPGNPFTPDVVVFDQNAKPLRTLGKPADAMSGSPDAFQPGGPAVDIAFEHGPNGGRLFATDNGSNGGRISVLDPVKGTLTALVTGLPGGPTGQLALRGGWIYWGAGATTNNGVVDFNGGQPDIPCQDITLSQNVFDSGGGILSSGYSAFGHTNKDGTVPAFFNATTGKVRQGVCNGAVLRAQLGNLSAIEPFSWGYRNGYAIRFAPDDHPLAGGLSSLARTVLMKWAHDLPTMLRSHCTLPAKTPMVLRTITVGPTASASCRRTKLCLIRSAHLSMHSASSTPRTRPACARPRASSGF